MGRRWWSADGGSEGQNLTTANSGGSSGQQATLVTPNNTAAQRYLSAAARHGPRGLRVEYTGGAAATYTEWAFEAATARGVLSFAFRLSALPSGDVVVAGVRGGANANWMAQLVLKASGAVHPRNSATTELAALPGVTLAPGTWYRAELGPTKGTGTGDGAIEGRVWADGAAPPAFTTLSGVNAGTTDCSHVRIGVPQSGAASFAADFDDVHWQEGLAAGVGLGNWPSAPIEVGAGVALAGSDFTGFIDPVTPTTITDVTVVSGTIDPGTIVVDGLVVFFPQNTADTVVLELEFTPDGGSPVTKLVAYVPGGSPAFGGGIAYRGPDGWL